MSDLRAAIIGYGLAGSVFHAPLIASTPGMKVASVVTSNPERSAHAAREHPAATVFPAPTSSSPIPEHTTSSSSPLPNDSHAPLARRALSAGLPVVVDKPLAPTAAEARELVEHAEAGGVPLTVFLNRRWDSDQITLRRLLDEGILGRSCAWSRASSAGARPWTTGRREQTRRSWAAACCWTSAAHLVDQALQLLGPVETVYAEIASPRGGAADDDAFWRCASLRRAQPPWTSAFAAAPGPRLRVLGDRAAYVVEGLDGQEDALRGGRRPGEGPGWGAAPPENWGPPGQGRRVRAGRERPRRHRSARRGDAPRTGAGGTAGGGGRPPTPRAAAPRTSPDRGVSHPEMRFIRGEQGERGLRRPRGARGAALAG